MGNSLSRVERRLRQLDVIPLDNGTTAVTPNPPPVEEPDTPPSGYDPADPDLDDRMTEGT